MRKVMPTVCLRYGESGLFNVCNDTVEKWYSYQHRAANHMEYQASVLSLSIAANGSKIVFLSDRLWLVGWVAGDCYGEFKFK